MSFFLEQARKLMCCTAISHMFFSQLFSVGGEKLVPCFLEKMKIVSRCLPLVCIIIFVWLFSSKRGKSLQNEASFMNFIEILYLEYFLLQFQ